MARRDAFEAAKRRRFNHFGAGFYFQDVQIRADQPCRDGVGFYEDRFFRPAADCLDSDRARAGVKIDEERILNRRTENVEKRFAQTIARRAEAQFARAFQKSASECTCDYAHDFVSGRAGGPALAYPTDAN